jgi:hypothetical protein
MRLPIFSLLIVNAALISAIDSASAQSPYSYRWCARTGGDNACYFESKEQCMTTLSGIGAYCIENPEYRPSDHDRTTNHAKTR